MANGSRKNLWSLLVAAAVTVAALPLVKIDVAAPLPPAVREPLSSGAAPTSSPGVPDETTIAALEAAVRLPEGAEQLGSYDRYYAFERLNGRLMIRGIYVSVEKSPARGQVRRVASVDQLPHVADGGCGVVTVIWDVHDRRIADIYCNGVA